MNCAVCLAYLREKNHCPGCRVIDPDKAKTRLKCIIKNCETIRENRSGFCYECAAYPCRRLKALDKRYRTKYSMSMLENLDFIRAKGLAAFVKKEKERWRCPECGGVICVHRAACSRCGAKAH